AQGYGRQDRARHHQPAARRCSATSARRQSRTDPLRRCLELRRVWFERLHDRVQVRGVTTGQSDSSVPNGVGRLNSTASTFEDRFGRLALTGAAFFILVALLALAGVGWAYVSAQSGSMTMPVGADFESFAIFLATWVVMMAAMMFPSAAPVVVVYAQYTRRRVGAWPLLATLFVAGYLMIWGAVGVGAYVLVGLVGPLVGAIPSVQAAPQVFLGAAIGAGGLYQLTPLKEKCLGHCRSPVHWLIGGFRSVANGGLGMGISGGVFCVVCR